MPEPLHSRPSESDGTRQVRDSILYVLPLLVGTLLPIVTLPILTRILSTEDYGILALAQVYAAVAGGLANFGMTIAYDRNYFQYRQDPRRTAALLFSSMAFVAVLSAGCVLATFIFRVPLSQWIFGTGAHGKLLVVALAASCLLYLNQFYLRPPPEFRKRARLYPIHARSKPGDGCVVPLLRRHRANRRHRPCLCSPGRAGPHVHSPDMAFPAIHEFVPRQSAANRSPSG